MTKRGNQNHKMGDFAKHPHKEDAMRALQNGRSITEVAKDFGISERTVYRYSNQLVNYTPLPPVNNQPDKKESIQSSQELSIDFVESNQNDTEKQLELDENDDSLTENTMKHMAMTSENKQEVRPENEAKEAIKMYSSSNQQELSDNIEEYVKPLSQEGSTTPVQINEGGITLNITLPPVVLTLFDFAKAAELVNEETDLDKWLFECVHKRFELDYKLQLALVPVDREDE